MVGEIQPPLRVFPNRDKGQLNKHVGSEIVYLFYEKMFFQFKTPISPEKNVRIKPQKVHPNPPIIKRVMALEKVVLFEDFPLK